MRAICGSCGDEIANPVHSREHVSTGEVQWICDNCMPPPPKAKQQLRYFMAKVMLFAVPLVILVFLVIAIQSCFS